MLLLSRKDIEQVVTIRDMIEADKLAFSMNEKGAVRVPLRTVIPQEKDGTFLFMPSYAQELGAAAVKVINVFPQNYAKGLATCPAQVLLIDGETGYVNAMLDGTYVTQLRTGAASGAAFDVLAKKHCRKGALIGTGGQAETQLLAMLEARKLETVSIYGADRPQAEAFVARMQKALEGCGTSILLAESSDECIDDADLIITVTTSPVPVFDGNKVKAGATVSCVGTYEPEKHELDPALLPRASKIICDSKQAALSETGDLLIPIAQGIITEDDICGSLGEVINGTLAGRENDEEIIVFETVGIAAQDVTAAKIIYDRAVAAGIGTVWE